MHQDPNHPKSIHIETLGRFGNYFYVQGWHTGSEQANERFNYEFLSDGTHITPEFGFYYRKDSVQSDQPRLHFLHLFWINDGFKTVVDAARPIQVLLNGEEGQPQATATCRVLRDNDKHGFLQSLQETGNTEVLGNRMIQEIVASFDLGGQYDHFRRLADRIGWMQTRFLLEKHVINLNTQAASHLLILLYADWAEITDVSYMPPSLKEGFVSALGGFDCIDLCEESAVKAIVQLARFNQDAACGFAHDIIQAQKPCRTALAKLIHPCLPRHSQWWIHNTIVTPDIGDEQAADALNVAGYAAAGQRQHDLSRLCYRSALCIKEDAQSAAWNYGWLRAEKGDMAGADKAFSFISRHYPNQSLCTAWPNMGSCVWPNAPFPADLFVLPHEGGSWPRISIVTPSYNQGEYIEETILSILNQNYPNLQYIVVDGNSTDDTRAVLERYRDRIDHLVIESDNGQTEAINKGLRLVDGELVAWLNSDDMYAPGALHAAALAWMDNDADVIAGQCLEHTDRRFLLINKPAARNLDFNPPQLARIFKYWLKGFYFYQPEVFFTKRILDEVGLLDESLYYSMDYDLWMRFAKANARLDVINWPVAFFRKHDAQKTSNLIDCIEEQARVRTSHYKLEVEEERRCQILRGIDELRVSKQISVGIVTKRIGKIFANGIQDELDNYIDPRFHCVLSDDEYDPEIAHSDLVILLVHVLDDLRVIEHLRASRPDRCIVGWFWDNHHHLFENYAVAEALDVVIPGHALYSEYLRNDRALVAGHVPLCVTQWTRQDAAAWYVSHGNAERNPALYGGFVDYHFEPNRSEFLRVIMECIPGHALNILSEDNLKAYFGRTEEDRFAEWCGYQTSLVLPLRNDLSQRVFDALLAGQIPLVPEEIRDLDAVIPRDLQESLPIIRFSMKKPDSCLDAFQKATARATKDGLDGCRRRHEYALANASFSQRISMVIEKIFQLV